MQFFGRTEEIKRLQNQLSAVQSQHESRMVCLMGRRRVGKTTLLLKAFENKSCLVLYLYVPNRCTLNELVRAWLDQVVEIFKLPFPPAVQTPTDVLQVVMHLSKDAPCVIIIDECQELNQMDPAFWGKLQELWDRCRQSSRTLLVMSGSIISALEDIFGNNSKPLYGRLNDQMMLMPFGPSDMCTIMGTLAPLASDLDLLTVYAMTGGVAKYIELLDEAQCLTQESLLFRRIVAMGRFIRPVDMQQHKGAAFRRSQGCLCLGVQIRIHIASSPLYREKLHVQQPGNPLYQLLAADHGALLGKWRQCYRNRLSPQKHTSFFRQQSFKGMAQYQASLRAQCPLPAGRNLRYNVIHSMRHVGKYQQCLIAAQPVIGKCRILYLCRGTARHGTAALSIQRVAAAPQQQVIGPDGDSGPQRLYIASEMYRQIRYPQQAQYAVQCFR